MDDAFALYCWVKLGPPPVDIRGSKGTDPHSTPIHPGPRVEPTIQSAVTTGALLRVGVARDYAGLDPTRWATVSELFVGRTAADVAIASGDGQAWRTGAAVYFPVRIGLLLDLNPTVACQSLFIWFKQGDPPADALDPIPTCRTAVVSVGVLGLPFSATDASPDPARAWTAAQPLQESAAVDPDDGTPGPKTPQRVIDWYDSTAAKDRFLLRLDLNL